MLSKEELKNLKYDPNKIQKRVLDFMSESTNGKVNITNPTNPFIMGLEAMSVLSSNALEEMVSNIRKVYPSLARTNEEIYHHITDVEFDTVFSKPSVGAFLLLLNLKDIRNEGIKVENGTKIIIPKHTEITVDNHTFTLLNNINLTVYNNREVFVEQSISDSNVNINEVGIIESNIISDEDGIEWVILETLFLQVKRTVVEDTVISSTGIHSVHTIDDNSKYYFANVYYKNSNTNNKWKLIEATHSDILYNRKDPIVKITYLDNKLTFDIARAYLNTDMISGNIKFEIFTTSGYLELPLNNYSIEDFKLTLGDTEQNNYTAVTPNVQILSKSRISVNGGSDGMSVEELKKSIINHTVKKGDIPITEFELKDHSKKFGFDIYKVRDTITDRLYTASKKTPSLAKGMKSRADLFNVTSKILLSELVGHPSVINNNNNIVIKSNTVFKDSNGTVNIITNSELERLKGLSKIALANELRVSNYYFNPYYYIIDKTDNTIDSRIYNLDTPLLSNLRILSSLDTNIKVNISMYEIVKVSDGYKLIFKPISGQYFDKLNKSLIKIQLSIPVKNSTSTVKFIGSLDTTTGLFVIDIKTNFQINTDNSITITNGEYTYDFKTIDLTSVGQLYIYSTDISVINNNNQFNSELHENGEVLVKESLTVNIGKEINYLWNKVYLDYTPRKFLKAENDIPMVYAEDVYKFHSETGSIFNPNAFNEQCKKYENLDYDIIHRKGDIVYDYGKIVYKYKKGDNIRDDNGMPVINEFSGIIRFVDMMVMNYEYLTATNVTYKKYLKQNLLNMDSWLTTDLYNVNRVTLDNTVIKYKPYKTNKNIKIHHNDKYDFIDHTVSPKVTLYIDKSNNIDDETLSDFKTIVGDTLHSELENTDINITTIKNKIASKLTVPLKGIKIEKITNTELEAFKLVDDTERLSIKKILTLTSANDTVVEYDIEIEIVKI